MQRRRLLQSIGAATAGLVGLAGCGSPGPGVDNETDPAGDGAAGTDGGLFTDTPGDGMGTDTPADGMGTDTPADGMGTDTPGDGMGTDTPAGSMGTDLPDLTPLDVESPDGISVMNTEMTTSDGTIQVTGVIENTGDETFEEVEVAVTLLDDNDELVGQFFHDTEEAEIQSLEPGAQWEFSVDFPGEDVEDAASYRIDVDTDINQVVDFDVDFGTETTAG